MAKAVFMAQREDKKKHLLETALTLFSQSGFQGTSMDKVTKATGLSKATIYKYFFTKEILIAAVLNYSSAQSLARLQAIIEDDALSLEEKIHQRFQQVRSAFGQDRFYGCHFQLAYREYRYNDLDIAESCEYYKTSTVDLIEQLYARHNVNQPRLKALQAEMIFNGLLTSLYHFPDENLIDMAEQMYLQTLT